MNRALDVQEITRIIPVTPDNESDERQEPGDRKQVLERRRGRGVLRQLLSDRGGR